MSAATLRFFRAAPFPRLRVPLPLVGTECRAGFPSPADDHIEEVIDLNELLIRNPPATFFVRAVGLSMLKAGILDGDILVVDRSESACHGDIVVACLEGEFTVKRLRIGPGRCVWLVPESDDFQPVRIESERDFAIWGVVTGKISQFGRFRRGRKDH